jgi:hypothetical protein
MALANTLLVLFALFTAVGAYMLFAQRSRRAGILAVVGVVLFFAALVLGIQHLVPDTTP